MRKAVFASEITPLHRAHSPEAFASISSFGLYSLDIKKVGDLLKDVPLLIPKLNHPGTDFSARVVDIVFSA